MSIFSPSELAIVALAFLLAGIVKGIAGMGLPTVAMGVLGSFLSPAAAAALLIVPSFVTNVWQLLTGPSVRLVIARLRWMMLGILVGTLAGSWVLAQASTRWTGTALGAALTLYALWSLFARPLHVPPRLERWLSPVVGVTTGLITGVTGVFAIPAVPYIQALGFNKDDLIQALGLSFTVSTIALAAGLARGGALHVTGLLNSLLATLPALLGMWLGTVIRARISAVVFRRAFLTILGLLGMELMIRALM